MAASVRRALGQAMVSWRQLFPDCDKLTSGALLVYRQGAGSGGGSAAFGRSLVIQGWLLLSAAPREEAQPKPAP